MCGIVGAKDVNGNDSIDPKVIGSMNLLLKHRGPDDGGYFFFRKGESIYAVDEDSPLAGKMPLINSVSGRFSVALANRRLSIIDVTERGHQPITYSHYVLVFNGELYNYREIRKELEGKYDFSSDSDTEVLLKAVDHYGLEEALKKFIGMYAFLIYDNENDVLMGARDRFGIKPIFYTKLGTTYYFSSEIKAFSLITKFFPNKRRIASYIAFDRDYDITETFFEGVYSLPPASYFSLTNDKFEIRTYWDPSYAEDGESSDEELKEFVRRWKQLFYETVKLHLRTDVPLGFELSGGVDSSTLVASTTKMLSTGEVSEKGFNYENIKLYSVVIEEEPEINEEKNAQMVSESLGLYKNHVKVKISPKQIMDEIDKIIYYQEEPPEGASTILHWFLVKRASKDVKVLLNGQGGDELLGGYHAYIPIYISSLFKRGRYIKALSEAFKLRHYILDKLTLGLKVYLGLRKKKAVDILGSGLSSIINEKKGVSNKSIISLNQALYRDLTGGRLYEILKAEDRNGMAFSVEIRVPYVNHVLADFVLQLPEDVKIRKGWTKYLHRLAFEDLLPKDVIWSKRKIGFQAPEVSWLLAIKDDFLNIMGDSRLVANGYLNSKAVKKMMDDLMRGNVDKDLARLYWRVYFLEKWYRTYVGS